MFAEPSDCGFALFVNRRVADVEPLGSEIEFGGFATGLPPDTHVAVYGLVSVAALTVRLYPTTRTRTASRANEVNERTSAPRALVHAELNMSPSGPPPLMCGVVRDGRR